MPLLFFKLQTLLFSNSVNLMIVKAMISYTRHYNFHGIQTKATTTKCD